MVPKDGKGTTHHDVAMWPCGQPFYFFIDLSLSLAILLISNGMTLAGISLLLHTCVVPGKCNYESVAT
jgi:hypothetical protein